MEALNCFCWEKQLPHGCFRGCSHGSALLGLKVLDNELLHIVQSLVSNFRLMLSLCVSMADQNGPAVDGRSQSKPWNHELHQTGVTHGADADADADAI